MAGDDIEAGTILTKDLIFAMRPKMYARGLPSEKFEEVVGKTIKVSLKKYDPIIWDVLK